MADGLTSNNRIDTSGIKIRDLSDQTNALNLFRDKVMDALKNKPDAVDKLRKIDKDPYIKFQMSSQDSKDFSLLKKLVPALFADSSPSGYNIPEGTVPKDVGEGLSNLRSSQSSKENTLARAEIGGVDVTGLENQLDQRGVLTKLFAGIATGERTPAALVKETAIANDYRSQNIKMIEKLLAEQQKIKAQSESNTFSDIFKNPETGRVNPTYMGINIMDWLAGTEKYEHPESENRIKQIEEVLLQLKEQYAEEGEEVSQYDSMSQAIKAAAKNDPGPYQDKFWEDILADTNPLGEIPYEWVAENQAKREKLKELEGSYMNNNGTIDIKKYLDAEKEKFEIAGIGGKAAPEFLEGLMGTPNTAAGLYLGLAMDPFPETVGGLVNNLFVKPFKSIMKATGLGTKLSKTEFAKGVRTWGRALSFDKDPVTKALRDGQQEMNNEYRKFLDELEPHMTKVGKNKEYKEIAKAMTEYMDKPPWKSVDIYKDIKETRIRKKKIMKYITETIGDTTNVKKLKRIEKQLDGIESTLKKWYKKIDDTVMASKKSGTAMEIEGIKGNSYEEILRKWVKEKGGIKTEYVKKGNKLLVSGEYSDINKTLRSKNGIAADELAASLKTEMPEVAGGLKIDGDDSLRQALKKDVPKIDVNLTTEDYRDHLLRMVQEDMQTQSKYIEKYGKPKKGSLTELIMTKEDLEEMRNLVVGDVEFKETPFGKEPWIDKGTGKQVTKQTWEEGQEVVEMNKRIRERKKMEEAFTYPEHQDTIEFLRDKYKQWAKEEGTETIQDYVPYRKKAEDIFYGTRPKAKDPLTAISPKDPTFQKKRQFKSLLQREKVGKISTERDAFKLAVTRFLEHAKFKARKRIASALKNVAGKTINGEVFIKKIDDLTPKEYENWQKIIGGDGTPIEELTGYAMPMEYAEVMARQFQFAMLDKPTKALMNAWDKTMHLMKGYMTVANVGFHMRNFYSNFWHLYLKDGMMAFDLGKHTDADQLITSGSRDGLVTLSGIQFKASDLAELAKDTNVFNTGFIRSDGAEHFFQKIEWLQQPRWRRVTSRVNPFSRENILLKGGDLIGGYIENHARLVGFLNEMEKVVATTGAKSIEDLRTKFMSNVMDAGDKTKHFMIDYSDLSSFERNVNRRGIPFYSWLRKNSELEIEQLFKQPKKFSMIPKLKNYVESMSEDKEVESEYLYDYLEKMFAVRLSGGDDDESFYYGMDMPFQDLSMWGKPLLALAEGDMGRMDDFWKDLASAGNPMIKTPLEQLFRKELFFDRDIRVDDKVLAPPWMQMLNLGEKGAEGQMYTSGRLEHLARQIPFIQNIGKLMPPEEWEGEEQGRTESKYLTDLFSQIGLKTYPFSKEKGETAYNKQLKSLVDNEMRNIETIQGEGTIPTQGDMASAMKQIYETLISDSTGMNDIRELEDILAITGSSKDLNFLLQQLKEPYYEEADKIRGLELFEILALLKEMGHNPTNEEIQEIIKQKELEKLGMLQ